MNTPLAEQFNAEMLSLFARTGQATRDGKGKAYWPRYFLRKVKKDGGEQVAHDLLAPSDKAATGFGRLAEVNRLDLSVEYLVLQPKWAALFTDQERQIARSRLEKAGYFTLPEEVLLTPGLSEGAVYTVQINAYERNPEARRKCIAHYGATCAICEFNFNKVYGDVAKDYIHVHHLKPLKDIGEAYVVDPVADLRPVCPNCHAVIHIGGECRSIETVKHLIQAARHQ